MKDFVYRSQIDFTDTDAGGIAHFTSFLRWVAKAEAAWFKALGFDAFERLPEGGYYGFPRVSVQCDYHSPVYPGDDYAIVLAPKKVGYTSFTYSFKVYRGDENGKLAAEGSMAIVYSVAKTGGDFKLRALPKPLAALKE